MASALRGDFARLRERGVATTFAPAERPSLAVARPVAAVPAALESPAASRLPSVVPGPAQPAPVAEEPRAASWLARFLAVR